MKGKLCKLFVGLFVLMGIVFVYNNEGFFHNAQIMNAAEGYEGEKIIDFDAFLTEGQVLNAQSGSVYMISDEHRLFYK